MDAGINIAPIADGCTLWLDGLGPYDWRHCCDIHDLAYYELAPKLDADLALAGCVLEAGGPILGPLMATVMFAGLTLFGWVWYEKAKSKRRSQQ